jgi:hypothetical protein
MAAARREIVLRSLLPAPLSMPDRRLLPSPTGRLFFCVQRENVYFDLDSYFHLI